MSSTIEKNNAAQATGGNQVQQKIVVDNINHSSDVQQNQTKVINREMPNFQIAQEFLTLLDEKSERFTFQTFDDNSKRKDRSLARIFHGTLEQYFEELCRLQTKGAGVFVTVNETDGSGRETKNITRVRSVFVDLDGSPLDPVISALLSPHIVIQSSPERFHVYWLIEGLKLEQFSTAQKFLIDKFQSDPAVHDRSRVMRLPGFIHLKGEPFQTKIFSTTGELPFKAGDFLSAFNITTNGSEDTNEVDKNNKVLKALQHLNLLQDQESVAQGRWKIICPWKHLHTTVGDTAHYFEPDTNGYKGHGLKCFHDHCSERKGTDLLDYLGINTRIRSGDAKDWNDPVPLPEGLPPVSAFSEELLPEGIRGWVLDIAERMQIPPDFSATSAMVVTASLIGRQCGIFPKEKDDWLVVPNLWGAIIGRPSLMKSPAIGEIIKPLDRMIIEAKIDYENACKSHENTMLIQEVQKGALKDSLKKAAKNNSTQEHLQTLIEKSQFSEDGEELFQGPVERRYKTEDGTVPKIGQILKENPNGILIHRDELTGWLKSLDMYGREGDRAFYLESWNGSGSFTVDRIGRGTLYIPALCLSVLGGIQPGPLNTYVSQANSSGSGDDGLLQRFQLTVWPDVPKNWVNIDRFPDTEEKNRAYEVFGKLANLNLAINQEGEIPGLRFNPNGAQQLFNDWRENLEKKLRNDNLPASVESHLAKYRSLMPSIALNLHLVEALASNQTIGEVSEKCASKAVKWCEYLECHVYRLYSMTQNPAMDSAKALLEHIKQGDVDDCFSPRDIYRAQWSKLTTPDETKEAIKVLVDYGWIFPESQKPETYRLHPSVRKTP